MITNTLLNPSHDAFYRENGYIILDLLTERDLGELRTAFSRVERWHQSDIVASVLLIDLDLRRSIHESVVPVLERALLPVLSNYRFVLANFVSKRAASAVGKFPLHQDPTFVEEGRRAGISSWCPLVDVDLNNGCLGVVPGSHRLKNTYRQPAMLPYPDWVPTIESTHMRYLPMRAGQVLLMDNRVIHGSPPNLSDSLRVVAAGVAVPQESPLLCCHVVGQDSPQKTDVYEVPDDFYLRHFMTTRPTEGHLIKTVATEVEPLSPEKFQSLFHQAA